MTRGFQETPGPEDVGLEKRGSVLDAAIDAAFVLPLFDLSCAFSACDPGCPTGYDSPPYLQDGTVSCPTIGHSCTYFESEISCACDHHWWYTSWGIGCPPQDGGGPQCTDGGP